MTVARVAVSGTPPLSMASPSSVPLRLPIGVQKTADGLPEMEHEEKWVLPADFAIGSGATGAP